MPDGGASLFAAIGSALATSAPAAGAAATGAAATGAVATAAPAVLTAGLATGTTAAATAGMTVAEIAALAGTGASLGGTTAQLLAEKPKPEASPGTATRDEAQAEADRLSEMYRRRGRAAALLTAGGARGDVSNPNLGAAALLGA